MPYNYLPKSNNETIKITILGCGASAGVPRPNLDWGDCDSTEPKNRRRRASILIEQYDSTIVVDTGADFCHQMIDAKVTKLDAVIYTHMHADHTNGIDDLRSYFLNQNKRIPVYSDQNTLSYLQQTFAYCFKTPSGSNYPPILEANEIMAGTKFSIQGKGGDIEILPILQQHGNINSLGLRIGDVAYCTDVSAINNEIISNLQNLKYLIIGALQYKPHISHLSVSQALDFIAEVKPEKAYFTHMHNKLDYNKLKDSLPNNIEPAYDGLTLFV
jgi:phosphoribosyl 1,2-cyclic phosphate phosphodiesterase